MTEYQGTGSNDAVLHVGERSCALLPGTRVVLGREAHCDLALADTRVSREHAEVVYEDDRWLLRDLGSSNGIYLDGRRVTELRLPSSSAVRLADAHDGPRLNIELPRRPIGRTHAARAEQGGGSGPSAVYRIRERVRLGRDADNDIVLDDLLVSRHHAELRHTDSGLQVVDLGSRNGTYLNGRRVSAADLHPDDLLSIGRHQYIWKNQGLEEYVDTGRVSLRVSGLSLAVSGKRLLDDIGFSLDECSLVAVVGPSGAGKSTLLGALAGIRPTDGGTVRYQGRDFHEHYADLRHRVGLVPQDDILHRQLTVRRALDYAAQLRFPQDVTATERAARIDVVLAQLGLTERADQRIDTLSGGQRKRTSVALELLTEPSLLYLDEPTSGLDPALDRDLMLMMRELADRGRTVIVVTHSVLHLAVADRILVLARGGTVAYFGPPGGVLEHFGADDYAQVFQLLAEQPELWTRRWRDADSAGTPRVQPGLGRSEGDQGAAGAASEAAAPRRQSQLRQLAVLCRRMVSVTVADRPYAAMILGLPAGLALLLRAIPGSDGLSPPAGTRGQSSEAAQLLVVLIIGAVFMGAACGIREFVGEKAIYRRERGVGLSPAAYVGSKLVVFGAISVVQAVLFVTLGLLGRPGARDALVLGAPPAELIAVVALVGFTCAAAGLLLGTFLSTTEQTMPVLVGMVMAQLVLSGGLFSVVGQAGLEQTAMLSPSRWGYAAAAATVGLRDFKPASTPAWPPDALWRHRTVQWVTDVGVLAGQAALFAVAARLALIRLEPRRRTARSRRAGPG